MYVLNVYISIIIIMFYVVSFFVYYYYFLFRVSYIYINILYLSKTKMKGIQKYFIQLYTYIDIFVIQNMNENFIK